MYFEKRKQKKISNFVFLFFLSYVSAASLLELFKCLYLEWLEIDSHSLPPATPTFKYSYPCLNPSYISYFLS